jgi:hypothetical protein
MTVKQVIGRVFYLIMAGLFGYAAVKQGDDPDTLLWVVIYGLAAALCVIAAIGLRVVVTLAGLGAAGYAVYLGVLYFGGYEATVMFPEDKASQQPASELPWYRIEEPREMVGLIVITVVIFSQLLWYYLTERPKQTHGSSSESS